MIANSLTTTANLYAPLNSVGQKPIGQEDSSARITTTKPVEQLSSSGKQQLRTRDKFLADEGQTSQSRADSSSGAAEDIAGENSESRESSESETRVERGQEAAQEREEQLEIRDLAARDREVRAHERAHAAVGGQYAGAPTYQFERGPDGVNYAISGEVSIDVSKEPTPQETIQKAQIVRRAALAPAEPSPQDRRVAAQATRIESEAKQELAVQQRREAEAVRENREAQQEESEPVQESNSTTPQTPQLTGLSPQESAGRDNPPTGIGASTFTSEGNQLSSLSSSNNLSYTGSRLLQSIANASPRPNQAGSILSQLA